MKTPKLLLAFCILAILLSSCAHHFGVVGAGNATLTNADFRIVGFAYGRSQTSHILGIGGLEQHALVMQAKQDMVRNYPLERGQAFGQMTVDFKRFYFLPFLVQTNVYVSGEIIDFRDITEEEDDQEDVYQSFGDPVFFSASGKNAPLPDVKDLKKVPKYNYPEGGTGKRVMFRIENGFGEGELTTQARALFQIRTQDTDGKISTVFIEEKDIISIN